MEKVVFFSRFGQDSKFKDSVSKSDIFKIFFLEHNIVLFTPVVVL